MANNNRFSLFGRKKQDEEEKISPKDQEELDSLKADIDEIQQKTTFLVHGADQTFADKNSEDLKQIRDTINSVSEKYKSVTGDSMIEFLTRMALDGNKRRHNSSNQNVNPATEWNKKQEGMLNISKMLENPNNGIFNDLYMKEKSRINLMDEYDQIISYIPQLSQALDVITDNVISPDDFTKDIFNIFYNDKDIDEYDEDGSKIVTNLKELNRKYKFENKTRKLVRDTLKYGDQFVACLAFDKEFNKLFSEDADFHEILSEDKGTILNENNCFITEEQSNQLKEYLKEDNYEGNLVDDFVRMINENVTFTDNKYAILEEDILLEAEFKMDTYFTNKRLQSTQAVDLKDPEQPTTNKPTKKSTKTRGKNSKKSVMFNDNPLFQNIEEIDYAKQMKDELVDKKKLLSKENSKYYIDGSFMRVLDPRRVIKIYLNGHTYGYYYIETESNMTNNTFGQQNPLSKTSTFQLRSTTDIGITANSDKPKDLKAQLLLDIFLKNISKKLNKKFILDNDEFKEVLYTLLKEEYITKKKISIIYLSPEDVEHLYVNLQEEKGKPGEGYGESILSKILFTAKLYLAVLTCTLMMKVSRSADHRAFYIETGLSNDIEGTINSFVREIKSKEIKISDMGSVDAVLNSVGMFHDYYIPQINGEKTIDIDTVPGQQVDMDNDFLEYLRKAMISGLGIPSSFLSYSDEMEFARSVSQMNGMFLRTIVTYQKYLGYGFSEVFKKLYRNEYGREEEIRSYEKTKTNSEEKISVVDYDKIEVRFPSPATLNMTNLAEQIATVTQVSEFIVNTLVGDASNMSDPSKRDNLNRQVTKDLIQNIDWNKYEEMMRHLPIDQVEDRLKASNDMMMDQNMMGMDDMNMNDNMNNNMDDNNLTLPTGNNNDNNTNPFGTSSTNNQNNNSDPFAPISTKDINNPNQQKPKQPQK